MTNWREMYKDLTINSLYEEADDVMNLIDRKTKLLKENIGNLHELSKIYGRISRLYEQLAIIEDMIEEKDG